jgi:hypothetical protein
MMYVLALELERPFANSEAIEHWVEENSVDRFELLPRLWLVEAALGAAQIRTGLGPLLGPKDRLVVIKTAHEAVARGLPEAAAQWLARTFPDSMTERVPGR